MCLPLKFHKTLKNILVWYETTYPLWIRHALEHYLVLVRSGFIISLVLWTFEITSNPAVSIATKSFSESLVKHASHPPVELVFIGLFILSISIMATGTWGRILRKFAVKPINELFIHTIGITAGIFIVVFIRNNYPSGANWFTNLAEFLLLELLMFIIFGFSTLILEICELELDGFLKSIIGNQQCAIKLAKVIDFLSVPVGMYFMWACYTDLARIGAGIQH